MIRRPPRSTRVRSSAASDVYKRQVRRRQPAGTAAASRGRWWSGRSLRLLLRWLSGHRASGRWRRAGTRGNLVLVVDQHRLLRDGALETGELLVVVPALVDVGLRHVQQLLGELGPAAGQHREPALLQGERPYRHGWLLGVELERVAALFRARVEPVERPVAAGDGLFPVSYTHL